MDSKKSPSDIAKKSAYRWVMLILSWLLYFSFGLINTTLSIVVTPIMNDLNMNYGEMGFVLGCWQLVYIFIAQPMGLLIDRIGTYRSLLLGASIISLSAGLRGLAINFETLAIFVALFGIGGSMISIGLPKLASIWFMGKERGTASGFYNTGSIVGSMVSLSMTNSVVLPVVGNWKNVYLIYSFVGLSIAIIWLFFGRRSPHSDVSTMEVLSIEEKNKHNVKSLFKNRNIWLIVIIGITSFLTSHGLSNWLPKILEQKGMTPAEVGFALSFLSIFAIGGSILIPKLPYIVRSNKLAISIVLFIQGIIIFALGVADGLTLWVAVALDGLMRGLMPLLMVTLMDMPEIGSERMGAIGGLFFAIGEIGGFGGPFIMGLLKDFTGIFLPGIILLVAVSEASIILVTLIKSDARHKQV